MGKIFLGIDFGTKRIGLALAYSPIAEPLTIIEQEGNIDTIVKYISKHQATDIVIGLSEGQMAEKTKEFSTKLQAKITLPIHFQNETLSSLETHENLQKIQAKKSKKRQNIDHLAATSILQDYLDENRPFSL